MLSNLAIDTSINHIANSIKIILNKATQKYENKVQLYLLAQSYYSLGLKILGDKIMIKFMNQVTSHEIVYYLSQKKIFYANENKEYQKSHIELLNQFVEKIKNIRLDDKIFKQIVKIIDNEYTFFVDLTPLKNQISYSYKFIPLYDETNLDQIIDKCLDYCLEKGTFDNHILNLAMLNKYYNSMKINDKKIFSYNIKIMKHFVTKYNKGLNNSEFYTTAMKNIGGVLCRLRIQYNRNIKKKIMSLKYTALTKYLIPISKSIYNDMIWNHNIKKYKIRRNIEFLLKILIIDTKTRNCSDCLRYIYSHMLLTNKFSYKTLSKLLSFEIYKKTEIGLKISKDMNIIFNRKRFYYRNPNSYYQPQTLKKSVEIYLKRVIVFNRTSGRKILFDMIERLNRDLLKLFIYV